MRIHCVAWNDFTCSSESMYYHIQLQMIFGILILYFPLFSVNACSIEDELVAVIAIYRHGDRTPIYFYPTDPHKDSPIWTAGPGDLTHVGKKRMFELGQWLRKRYDGFISQSYKKDELYVVSSDEDRCISSAAAKLAGLFPPNCDDRWNPDLLWQPVPVHTLPKPYDDIFNTYTYVLKYKKLSSMISTFEDEESKNLCKFLTTKTGMKISNLLEALLIGDILFIEEQNNLSLPEWTREVYPRKLRKLRDDFLSIQTLTDDSTKLVVGRLLYEILQQFDAFAQEPSKKTNMPKMKMYSAHDINLHLILHVLHVPHSFDIPFGAILLFELRRTNSSKLYVQLVYKTNEAEIVPLRNNSLQCEYEDFKNMLKDISENKKIYQKKLDFIRACYNGNKRIGSLEYFTARASNQTPSNMLGRFQFL